MEVCIIFSPAAERRMIMACKYETSNGRCGLKGCYAYRHKCYTEDMCKCNEPPTNADRIRAMSDEELAWELMLWRCEAIAKYHGIETQYPDTHSKILDWLQQPAE